MRAIFFAIMLAACSPSGDQSTQVGSLEITHARAAPTPNGVSVSAGYLTIANHGQDVDRLIAASSTRAERVELHSMEMDGAVMRMRQVDAVSIPAGGEISLAPGGDHLMFLGVAEPFAAGETIPVHLVFEHNGATDLLLPVRRAAPH